MCQLRVVVMGKIHEVRECLQVLAEGSTFLQFGNGAGKLVNGVYLLQGDGGVCARKDALLQAGEDKVAIAREIGRHGTGREANFVPMIFAHPIMDGATTNAHCLCYLCLCEVGLEKEFFGLLLLFCFHGF